MFVGTSQNLLDPVAIVKQVIMDPLTSFEDDGSRTTHPSYFLLRLCRDH